MDCTCPDCGTRYSGRGGGHCRSCCLTFANDATATAHRVGGYNPGDKGYPRRCRTAAEMAALGWRTTPRGWTQHPEMTDERRAALRLTALVE